MTSRLRTVIYPVKELAQAKTLYGNLVGAEPIMDEPYYVQYNVGDLEVGLDPHGRAKGMTGPLTYWQVDDIETTVKELLGSGAELEQAISDVGGGRLIATIKDADGNVTGLTQVP